MKSNLEKTDIVKTSSVNEVLEDVNQFLEFEKNMRNTFLKMEESVKEINDVYDEIEEIIEDKTLEQVKALVDFLPWFMAKKYENQKIEAVSVEEELVNLLKEKQEKYKKILNKIFEIEEEIRTLLGDFYNQDKYEYISKNLNIIPSCSEKFKLVEHLRKNYNSKIPYV